jgi:hypothetical protein
MEPFWASCPNRSLRYRWSRILSLLLIDKLILKTKKEKERKKRKEKKEKKA